MRRLVPRVLFLTLAGISVSAFALAQSVPATLPAPAARLEFEVASVKPAAPVTGLTQVSAGVHVDGAQGHCAFLSVRDYIRIAYKVQDYQITGPDWIASERYDVDAKLPAGATRAQVPAMLQALLADRFGLVFHNASKELPVYALSLVKGGAKMTELPPNPEGNLDPSKGPVNTDAVGDANGTVVSFGNGSTISLQFAESRIMGTKITMDNLAHVLGRFEDRPVADRTELKGIYDIKLELKPEDFQVLMIRAAQAQGTPLPPQALALLNSASESSLHSELEKLGLRLDSSKAPVDMMMVDQVHKPTAQ